MCVRCRIAADDGRAPTAASQRRPRDPSDTRRGSLVDGVEPSPGNTRGRGQRGCVGRRDSRCRLLCAVRRASPTGWCRLAPGPPHVAAAQRDKLPDIIPPMNTGGWSAILSGEGHAGRRGSSDTAAAGVPYSLTLVDFECVHDRAASDPCALPRRGGLWASKAPRPSSGGTLLPRPR